VGEILELKEIAAMAEAYFVAVSPHSFSLNPSFVFSKSG
jgi:L-alanine-DL-glutamate epimerase-like enolase superfamily enzyme